MTMVTKVFVSDGANVIVDDSVAVKLGGGVFTVLAHTLDAVLPARE